MDKVKDIEHSFKLYYRQLCIYALHFIEDMGTVEDIVQEAFVGLLQRKEEVRDVKPYLYASVRNKCISYLKKQRVGTDVVPEDIPSEDLEDRSEIEARLWSRFPS